MNPKNAVSLREDLVKLACADQPRYLMWRFCLAIPNILIHSVSCHASCLYIQKIVYVSLRKACVWIEICVYSLSDIRFLFCEPCMQGGVSKTFPSIKIHFSTQWQVSLQQYVFSPRELSAEILWDFIFD